MPRSFLVVEDHPGNLEYVLHVLKSFGVTLWIAATEDEAIELARTQRPDLILMDIRLAAGDGRQAARRLKGEPETARIPVLAVTALALDGDRELCLAAGCDDYLSKPFTPQQLRTKIAELLGTTHGLAS